MDKKISIVKLSNPSNAVNVVSLFGNDGKRLSDACIQIMENHLYPYNGCYYSVSKPRMIDFYRSNDNLVIAKEAFRAAMKEWKEEFPEEVRKEETSRKTWEAQSTEQFCIIDSIAKNHHMHIYWLGNSKCCCEPDRFLIYKDSKCFGMIQCE